MRDYPTTAPALCLRLEDGAARVRKGFLGRLEGRVPVLCSLAVFPLWEVRGWGLGMMVLVVLMMMVVMMVVVMIVVLMPVLVLVLVLVLGKGTNERRDACEKDISTTRGCALGEIAVIAVRGIVWCAVGATCGSIYGGLLPDACVPRRGPGTAKEFSMACFVCAAWFQSASCMCDGVGAQAGPHCALPAKAEAGLGATGCGNDAGEP